MELSYPGYKSYYHRFHTKPFRTEYTTWYCNSREPLLYTQIPKHSWNEPRRPTTGFEYEADQGTKLTYLRPPFAARMTSYVIYQKKENEIDDHASKALPSKEELLDPGKTYFDQRESSIDKEAISLNMPQMSDTLHSLSRRGMNSSNDIDSVKRKANAVSQEKPFRKDLTSLLRQVRFKDFSGRNSQAESQFESGNLRGKFLKEQTSGSFKDLDSTQRFALKGARGQGRVAPRRSSLLSKHPNHKRYAFFHPTQEKMPLHC
ncbi:hypothetical protein P5673_008738 [Acropora cervicornis]|uniref:Uncharacterized protein n=1 Tax=Acropora cervicornis TaxID=6130 RepID=A0AAD9VAN2_ACRCE|nr:hypothetical protein P5673_008738 [Acropora cervicornis]